MNSFETNSSSHHVLLISPTIKPANLDIIRKQMLDALDDDGNLRIIGGSFGGEECVYNDFYTKLNYVMQDWNGKCSVVFRKYIQYMYNKLCPGALNNIFIKQSTIQDGYIDHQSEGTANRLLGYKHLETPEEIESTSEIHTFLFNENAYLITRHDNTAAHPNLFDIDQDEKQFKTVLFFDLPIFKLIDMLYDKTGQEISDLYSNKPENISGYQRYFMCVKEDISDLQEWLGRRSKTEENDNEYMVIDFVKAAIRQLEDNDTYGRYPYKFVERYEFIENNDLRKHSTYNLVANSTITLLSCVAADTRYYNYSEDIALTQQQVLENVVNQYSPGIEDMYNSTVEIKIQHRKYQAGDLQKAIGWYIQK